MGVKIYRLHFPDLGICYIRASDQSSLRLLFPLTFYGQWVHISGANGDEISKTFISLAEI